MYLVKDPVITDYTGSKIIKCEKNFDNYYSLTCSVGFLSNNLFKFYSIINYDTIVFNLLEVFLKQDIKNNNRKGSI